MNESAQAALRQTLEGEFKAHRRRLWDMAYRLTGTVSDADDVLQETFARAIATPPPDTAAPWFPWLVRVTMNVGRDVLRRRRRREYTGPWLPAPIETEAAHDPDPDPEQRYDLVESATFAFLLALEALSPIARAVVVLRDAFDFSVAETAVVLELTEANVRTSHHRARRIMDGYDRERTISTAVARREAQELFGRLLVALRAGDVEQVRAVLSEDVQSLTDANGEFSAATIPLEGITRVSRFLLGLAGLDTGIARARFTTINGMPALLMVFADNRRTKDAPRTLLRCEARDGKITRLQWLCATAKLAHLTF